jgi:predicted dehydrogenase
VIGCDFPGGRGQAHLKAFQKIRGARVVAICDADTANLERTSHSLRGQGRDVRTFQDLRELLALPDVDAITIATPNHWHSLAGIWACQAGKDVYVEKPVSHNIWEGRQLVAAAAKSGRIVQAGTQIRSNPGIIEAREWVRAGQLGRITAVRGLCYKRRDSIGSTTGPQAVPSTVNYDLWLGPAPQEAPRRKRFHYDWHWFWATGNGDVGNQGIHQMDLARWFLGAEGIAPRTLSVGGRFGYVDDGETPNTQAIVHDYPAGPLIFEVRGLPAGPGAPAMDEYLGASIGIVVHCEGGNLVIPSYTLARAYDRDAKLVKSFDGEGDHFQNFIDCVRSRRSADLRGPVAGAHVSSALCHTGNISHRLGRATPPGDLADRIKGDASLAEAFGRMKEHLAVHNIDLGKSEACLGLPLNFNPATERFDNNAAADALLTRNYRSPYTVPNVA